MGKNEEVEGTMSVEERVRYLLRAARRAEGEGDERVAEVFRKVAEEARPLEASAVIPAVHPVLGCCAE